MNCKITLRLASVTLVAQLGLVLPLLACTQEKSGIERLSDEAKDALDMREHERLKDAGEDLEDAVKDAGTALKEEAESMKAKAR